MQHSSRQEKINVVIPLKNPLKAKQRLSSMFNQKEREQLVIALFRQTLNIITSHLSNVHILVVTDSLIVENIATSYGVSVLIEKQAYGLNSAIEYATQWSVDKQFDSQLVLPPDLAQLDPAELNQLITMKKTTPGIILCPAKDYGTNAIVTTPPNVLKFQFGSRSYFKYKKKAQEKNILCQTLNLNTIKFDIDTPDDIKNWSQMGFDLAPVINASVNEMLRERVVA